eukprot:NODE_8511_length_406_cov_51.717087_g7635_i0.p2 GENE.NODE_8511_length_406_cov_51.717087_g7635_i0~~NODE_8511_length_406_cov_51.717087_g7635_i0.p2  ORF type:complete len:111 (+),score=19.14 NODE_8511_length_406_cov_51.717087_g7635_i0:57-389(+)
MRCGMRCGMGGLRTDLSGVWDVVLDQANLLGDETTSQLLKQVPKAYICAFATEWSSTTRRVLSFTGGQSIHMSRDGLQEDVELLTFASKRQAVGTDNELTLPTWWEPTKP